MKRFQGNNIIFILLGIFTLFVIYGTTIPFNFSGFHSALQKVSTIAWHPFYTYTGERASISDMVQNIMLFIPIGFLWGVIFQRIKLIASGFIVATLYGTALSVSVEALQLFTDDRVVSITDVIFNTFGSSIGFISILIGWYLIREIIIMPKLSSFLDSEAFIPFMFTSAVIAAEVLRPFDISLDLWGANEKLKKMVQNPLQWSSMVKDGPAMVLFYMVSTSFALRLKQSSPIRISGGILLLLMFLIICSIESVQFIIISRIPGAAGVLAGSVGILSGFLFYRMNMFLQGITLFVMFFISATCKVFAPFQFSSHYQPMNWIPFLAEYSITTMNSLGNVIEWTVLFAFTGYCTFAFFNKRTIRTALIIFWVCMIIIFEILQGFVVDRYPDISDVLVGVVALFTGVLFKARIEEKLMRSLGGVKK